MIVRTLEDVRESDNEIKASTWISRRYLLKKDKMNFSFHETIIFANTTTKMWYKNHLEAVYCVSGEGEIEAIDEKKKWEIKPGTLYALNKHDRHLLNAKTELRLLCVFSPPCVGKETHDEEGAYPLLE